MRRSRCMSLQPGQHPGFSSVAAKFQTLKMRKDEVRQLGAQIDSIVRQAEANGSQPKGCLGGIWAFLSRRLGRQRAVEITAATPIASSAARTSSLEVNSRIFGLAGVKAGDPAKKLDQAASVMRGRIEQLEERAAEQRTEALKLQKAGQKAQALRALKKAKQIEAQMTSNQAALDAVEQQVDMLAQAAMQKTLTSALASTSKSMKADGKMLGKAEKAIDDASDARDMATDLNQVMAEFAANGQGDVDEDELMAELEAMIDNEPPPPAAQPGSSEEPALAKAADIEALEARVKVWDDKQQALELASAMPAAPTGAPGTKKERKREERAGLLAASGTS